MRHTISERLHGEDRDSAIGILNRYLFETQLDLMDIYDLGDPLFRNELLKETGRTDLLEGYQQEIGNSILIKPYGQLRMS